MNTSELVITIQALPGDRSPRCQYRRQPCHAAARWLFNDSQDVVDEADPLCDYHVQLTVVRLIDAERGK